MIRWSIFRCPLLGSLKEQIAEDISHKPEPWLSHAISCLHKQTISPNATMIIIGLSEKDGTIGFVWLSLPDSELLAGWKSYSYLFHVFIKEDFRGMGYGKIGTKIACDFSKSLGVNGVLLATDNEGLRTKFYPSFGFRPLSSDPWLMKKIYRIPENKKSRSIALLRSVSHHDLSTIQSICGQPHWQHQMFTPARKKEEEVEEEFESVS
ncbi:MAG: GNAT family N-acetyltransferase [Chloroflexi bacterium]|nr:GNAT family N-acetyltransferase [Chloroflexota bacterium]